MRPIDTHERHILDVLALTDEGQGYLSALQTVSDASGVPSQRLDHLVSVWCAVAGLEVPTA